MRVVLYDDETMEALTVLHLPSWMPPRLKDGERMVIPIMRRLDPWIEQSAGFDLDVPPALVRNDPVMIWFEKFVRHGEPHWFAFTRDGENALSLKSVFLPGQWPAVHEEYRRGIVRGLGMFLK